jgi:iron complex outermembrane receptor protein
MKRLSRSKSILRLGAAAVVAAALVSPACAQTAPTSGGDAAEPADAEGGIGEIVVTAEKRETSAQKTAAAVTAVSGEQLVSAGIVDIRAVQAIVPGARFQQEGNSTQVFLRGIGSNADFANIEQGVSFNFNGLYIPREATSVPLYDIAQLEALPGPQGTLYGRSAIGGTVNVSFQRPTPEYETKLILEAGNYKLVHATAVQNVPLSSDLAIRAAVDYTYRDGVMKSGADSKDDLGARLSLLYEPSSDFSLYLWGYTAQKNGHTPNLVNKGFDPATGTYSENEFLTSNPWNDQREGALAALAPFGQPTAPDQTFNNWAGGAQIDIGLGDNVTLSYIPGYLYLKSDIRNYWLGALPARQSAKYNEVTQELRLSGSSTNFDWLVGLYGYRTVNSGSAVFLYGFPSAFNISNVLRNRLKGAAVFGQGTYSLTDGIRMTVGGRFGVDDRKGLGITPLDQVSTYSYSKNYTRFDYKLGFEFDLAPRVMAYVTYQTGYQPGTYNEFQSTPGNSAEVKPATLKAITAGIKTRLFDNRLQINNEFFYYDYRNLQLQAINVNAILNPIFNAEKVSIPGNQLDILYQPDNDSRFNLSVSYVHARNKKFVTPLGTSFNGLNPPYAADWTISGGASHDFHLGSGYIRAQADGRYESEWWADYAHSPGVRQRPHFKANASLTYFSEDERWSAGLWIKNIGNIPVIAASAAAGIPGPGTAYLEEPRTYGLRLTADF